MIARARNAKAPAAAASCGGSPRTGARRSGARSASGEMTREQTELSMRLRTRLTERFDIEHPIISAPMGMIAGGRLAAAVSNAGGLGLIGGGYGDGGWLEREFLEAGKARVGCGFLSGALGQQPGLLGPVVARQTPPVML